MAIESVEIILSVDGLVGRRDLKFQTGRTLPSPNLNVGIDSEGKAANQKKTGSANLHPTLRFGGRGLHGEFGILNHALGTPAHCVSLLFCSGTAMYAETNGAEQKKAEGPPPAGTRCASERQRPASGGGR